MILTGTAIHEGVLSGDIVIDPFDPALLSPNSYDFRLGNRCKTYTEPIIDASLPNKCKEFLIPDDGMVLQPGTLYLVNTLETMGSTRYVPIIRGRSSTGRLGLFINVTADLIDLGSINEWTLQLSPVLPIRIFPGMPIGQVTFWVAHGRPTRYAGKYETLRSPVESLSYKDFDQ